MRIVDRFKYTSLERITYASGARHYVCPVTGHKLPSVTTVLDKTSDKKELLEWKKRVGDREADRIKNEALALGTLMHTHLDHHIMQIARPGGNNTVRIMAEKMADQIIQHGLIDVSEVWGNEVPLFCEGLFAGTTDLVGVYRGRPAVMDFKTAKKIRKRNMINDYLLQTCAYAQSHNELHGTNINMGVIFMVSRDYEFEKFIIDGDEFKAKTNEWMDRFEMFLQGDHGDYF